MQKVKILTMTSDPINALYAGARQCYSAGWVGDNYPFDNVSKKKKVDLIQDCIKSGHMSVLEHASFTFSVDGVSRTLSHQLVRSRVGVVFSQQSQRYVNTDTFSVEDCITPPSIEANKTAKKKYDKILEKLFSDIKGFKTEFSDLMPEGRKIPNEDIRFLLPNASVTRVVFTMNCAALLNFFKERLCERAQWEIRSLANAMYVLCMENLPEVFTFAGAHCDRLGYCNQGPKRTCGRMPLKEDIVG